jgi:hypothetical protein
MLPFRATRTSEPGTGSCACSSSPSSGGRDFSKPFFRYVSAEVFKAAIAIWRKSTSSDLAGFLESQGIPVPRTILEGWHLLTMKSDGTRGPTLVELKDQGVTPMLLRLMCPKKGLSMERRSEQHCDDRAASARVVAAACNAVGAEYATVLNFRMEFFPASLAVQPPPCFPKDEQR